MRNNSMWDKNPWKTIFGALALPPVVTVALATAFIAIELYVLSPALSAKIEDHVSAFLQLIILPNMFLICFWAYLYFGSMIVKSLPGGEKPSEYKAEVMASYGKVIAIVNMLNMLLFVVLILTHSFFGSKLTPEIVIMGMAGAALCIFAASEANIKSILVAIGVLALIYAGLELFAGGLLRELQQGVGEFGDASSQDLRSDKWHLFGNLILLGGLSGGLWLLWSKTNTTMGIVLIIATAFAWLYRPEILVWVGKNSTDAVWIVVGALAVAALSQVNKKLFLLGLLALAIIGSWIFLTRDHKSLWVSKIAPDFMIWGKAQTFTFSPKDVVIANPQETPQQCYALGDPSKAHRVTIKPNFGIYWITSQRANGNYVFTPRATPVKSVSGARFPGQLTLPRGAQRKSVRDHFGVRMMNAAEKVLGTTVSHIGDDDWQKHSPKGRIVSAGESEVCISLLFPMTTWGLYHLDDGGTIDVIIEEKL